MSSKHINKINKLLWLIAENGEVYQTELPELTDSSYRQILRQLGLLEKSRLIRLKRTEPSGKRGKEKNVWEATFLGLVQVFAMKPLEIFTATTYSDNDFDLIAKRNKEKMDYF